MQKGYLLVSREGSGWGGIHSKAFLNLQTGLYVRLGAESYPNLMQLLEKSNSIDEVFENNIQNILNSPDCVQLKGVKNKTFNAAYIDCAVISDDGCFMMDQQIDRILLITNTYMKTIYSTARSNVMPNNKALKNWCENLLNISSGLVNRGTNNPIDVSLTVSKGVYDAFVSPIPVMSKGHSSIFTYHATNVSEMLKALQKHLEKGQSDFSPD